MSVNSNMGATWPSTNDKSGQGANGLDGPARQNCPLCRKSVLPKATNGFIKAQNSGVPNDGKANVGFGTSAGYHCPSCGHNFNWTKSTGKAGGPALVDNTNQVTAADM